MNQMVVGFPFSPKVCITKKAHDVFWVIVDIQIKKTSSGSPLPAGTVLLLVGWLNSKFWMAINKLVNTFSVLKTSSTSLISYLALSS